MSLALRTSPHVSPLGIRKPRVETHPDYVTSYGTESAELMVRAGQPLDPWQQDSITLMLAVRGDSKWACFECAEWVSRQNGKGGILEARVLAGLFLLGERLIMWSAHEYKTAMEAYLRVRFLVRNLIDAGVVDGDDVKFNNTNGEEGIEILSTGQRLKFIARSKSSGRGFSGDLNIIDEAFAYTFAQQAALMPTMSARPNPQIIYTSSPPLTGDTGEVMYALRRRGDPTAKRPEHAPAWVQDDSLGYRDYGLPGELEFLAGIDLDDIANWAAANPSLGIRITHETIRRERRSMSDEDFARERLGIWPRLLADGPPQWQVISEDAWTAALKPESQLVGRPAYGVYVPPDRSVAAIAAAGESSLGGRHIEVTGDGHILDYRPGVRWVIGRLVELEKHTPSVVVVDDKALADEAEAAGLTVHRVSVPDVITGCQLVYDGLTDTKDIRQIGQPELTDAVKGAIKRDVGGSWAWARRDLAVDVTPLAAGSLALFGHATPRVHRPGPAEAFAFYA